MMIGLLLAGCHPTGLEKKEKGAEEKQPPVYPKLSDIPPLPDFPSEDFLKKRLEYLAQQG